MGINSNSSKLTEMIKSYRVKSFGLSDFFAAPFSPLDQNPLAVLLSVRQSVLGAVIADYAYFDTKYPRETVKAKLEYLGAQDIQFVKRKRRIKNDDVDSQAILFRHEHNLFVVPAGTNDRTDAKRDADFFHEKNSWGGSCHNGVAHCAEALKGDISGHRKDKNEGMFFIGHSLGKGVAEKLGADYHFGTDLVSPVVRVMGYGGLRIWDEVAANKVNRALGPKLDFFRCGPDIVPCTPPEKLGFRDAIDIWEIDYKGRFLATDRQASLRRGAARLAWYFSPRPFQAPAGERTAAISYHLLRNSYIPLQAKAYGLDVSSLLIPAK